MAGRRPDFMVKFAFEAPCCCAICFNACLFQLRNCMAWRRHLDLVKALVAFAHLVLMLHVWLVLPVVVGLPVGLAVDMPLLGLAVHPICRFYYPGHFASCGIAPLCGRGGLYQFCRVQSWHRQARQLVLLVAGCRTLFVCFCRRVDVYLCQAVASFVLWFVVVDLPHCWLLHWEPYFRSSMASEFRGAGASRDHNTASWQLCCSFASRLDLCWFFTAVVVVPCRVLSMWTRHELSCRVTSAASSLHARTGLQLDSPVCFCRANLADTCSPCRPLGKGGRGVHDQRNAYDFLSGARRAWGLGWWWCQETIRETH